jgi:hypothetical protein
MPIQTNELKYFKSTNDIGGAITETLLTSGLLHDLFDLVESTGSQDGEVNYRCIYIANENATLDYKDVFAFLSSNTPSPTTSMSIGAGTSLAGGVEQTIANENNPPLGVTFFTAPDFENGVSLGVIPPESHIAIWFQRTVNSGTVAYTGDGCTLIVQGDSLA